MHLWRVAGAVVTVCVLAGGGGMARTPVVSLGGSIATGDPTAAPLASGVPDLTGTWIGPLRGRSYSLATTDKPTRLKLTARLTVSQTGGAATSALNFTAGGDLGLPTGVDSYLIQLGLDGESGNRYLTGFVDVFGTQTVCAGRAARSQRKMIADCTTITNDLVHRYKLKLRRE